MLVSKYWLQIILLSFPLSVKERRNFVLFLTEFKPLFLPLSRKTFERARLKSEKRWGFESDFFEALYLARYISQFINIEVFRDIQERVSISKFSATVPTISTENIKLLFI